ARAPAAFRPGISASDFSWGGSRERLVDDRLAVYRDQLARRIAVARDRADEELRAAARGAPLDDVFERPGDRDAVAGQHRAHELVVVAGADQAAASDRQ